MAMPTGGGGSPFDMAKLREMLDDPAIKEMAEQISSDPNFKVMAEQMQANMANMQAQMGALPPLSLIHISEPTRPY